MQPKATFLLLFAPMLLLTACGSEPALLQQPLTLTTCFGSRCNGLNANTSICANDAKTLTFRYIRKGSSPTGAVIGKLEIRYSSKCNAAWARSTRTDGYTSTNYVKVARSSDNKNYSAGNNNSTTKVRFTPMLDGQSRRCYSAEAYLGSPSGYNSYGFASVAAICATASVTAK